MLGEGGGGGQRYRLMGELGVHTGSSITCIAVDAGCSLLAVGDASGASTVLDPPTGSGLGPWLPTAGRLGVGSSCGPLHFRWLGGS